MPDKTVTLQYPNSDVVDVLHLYENLTGSKLIMDNFVQGKVNIFLSKPIPKDEAIKIIEMNLLMNGYSLVPAGDGIVKVIGTGRSRGTRGFLCSDETGIPEGEHVISFLFKLVRRSVGTSNARISFAARALLRFCTQGGSILMRKLQLSDPHSYRRPDRRSSGRW